MCWCEAHQTDQAWAQTARTAVVVCCRMKEMFRKQEHTHKSAELCVTLCAEGNIKKNTPHTQTHTHTIQIFFPFFFLLSLLFFFLFFSSFLIIKKEQAEKGCYSSCTTNETQEQTAHSRAVDGRAGVQRTRHPEKEVRHTGGQALPILWSEKEEVRIGYPNRNGRPSSEFPSFLREPPPFSFPPPFLPKNKKLNKKKEPRKEKRRNKKKYYERNVN